jgi:hypothetical protein
MIITLAFIGEDYIKTPQRRGVEFIYQINN